MNTTIPLPQCTDNSKADAVKVEQLIKFTEAIYEPTDIVELRLLGKDKRPVRRWVKADDLPGLYSELTDYNHKGYNIHAAPNPRKDFYQGGDVSVKLARCLFCDFDGILPLDGCGRWEIVSDRIYRAGLPTPDLTIHSGHGLHTYWRLSEPLENLEQWRQAQIDLNELLNADRKIKNPERLMRLPGFLNVKYEPIDCFIIQ